MIEFKNEFAWSVSRNDTFRKCRRMYYYQYYGYWGGWDYAADKRTRTIYILKQLQNRHMWAGSKVHECIEKTLAEIKADNKKINIERKIKITLGLMRKEFLNSKNKKYFEDPKRCALFEHEYGLDVSKEEWQANANNVVECLKRFFNSDVYAEIAQLSDNQWLELEKFPYFYLDDFKIYAAIDFAFRINDEIFIYDWKTGKEDSEKDRFQLACYGLFATHKWNIRPKNISLVDFYLSGEYQNKYKLSTFDLNEIQTQICSSIRKMQSLLDDSRENIASEMKFCLTEDSKTCEFCSFKKICPRFVKKDY